MDKRLLIIGGSPCSGKSTAAEHISGKYGAYRFSVDQYLDRYIRLAADRGYASCKAVLAMSPEQIWMRAPALQREEEFRIYAEISEFIFADLEQVHESLIVAEGAAFTPDVMRKHRAKAYICIVPSPEFQIAHYRERPWVWDVLKGCSDAGAAFDRWMRRDVLFAEKVKAECAEDGVPCIVSNGSRTVDELLRIVEALLHPA